MELVIDTSAIVAILQSEVEARRYLEAITSSDECQMSSANYVELGVVADRAGSTTLLRSMDNLLEFAGINLAPVTVSQARIARKAHSRFGRHSGHPAKLNFGDCFAYALAMDLGHPLLFKGEAFARTDVLPALN